MSTSWTRVTQCTATGSPLTVGPGDRRRQRLQGRQVRIVQEDLHRPGRHPVGRRIPAIGRRRCGPRRRPAASGAAAGARPRSRPPRAAAPVSPIRALGGGFGPAGHPEGGGGLTQLGQVGRVVAGPPGCGRSLRSSRSPSQRSIRQSRPVSRPPASRSDPGRGLVLGVEGGQAGRVAHPQDPAAVLDPDRAVGDRPGPGRRDRGRRRPIGGSRRRGSSPGGAGPRRPPSGPPPARPGRVPPAGRPGPTRRPPPTPAHGGGGRAARGAPRRRRRRARHRPAPGGRRGRPRRCGCPRSGGRLRAGPIRARRTTRRLQRGPPPDRAGPLSEAGSG